MDEVRSLILRITERCNLRCIYCYAADTGLEETGRAEIRDMSVETALRAVSLCCQPGGRLRIQFTGGEPLLNMKVIEAVCSFGKATGRKLLLSVQTNGTLLTPENCRKLRIMNCGVGVSLDGIGEANRLRVFPDGAPSFPAVVQGIRNLGAAGIRCNLTTVVTKANASALGRLPDAALWLGNVNGVGLDLFRSLGRGAGQLLDASEEDLVHGLTALLKRQREIAAAGIPFRFRELERLNKRKTESDCDMDGCGIYCYGQTEYSLAVDGSGNCWPCSSLAGQPGCLLGNLRDGLPERSGRECCPGVSETCRACKTFSLCRGGCPAGRLAFAGEPNRLTCAMNRTLLESMIPEAKGISESEEISASKEMSVSKEMCVKRNVKTGWE